MKFLENSASYSGEDSESLSKIQFQAKLTCCKFLFELKFSKKQRID